MGEQRPQVGQVQEQPAVVVRDAKDDVEHALLDLVEPHQAREQEGAHFGQRRSHRVPLLAEDVPEGHGAGGVDEAFLCLQPHLSHPLGYLRVVAPRLANARQVTLYVSQKHGYANAAERLRQPLQGDGLARAGRARDQAVTVGHAWQDRDRDLALAHQDGCGHGFAPFRIDRSCRSPSITIGAAMGKPVRKQSRRRSCCKFTMTQPAIR